MISSEGRNFQSLYKLLPGFTPPAELHSDAGNPQRAMGTNVNGMTYSNNNTKLDGATVSYPWLPHIVAYVPPADAVEDVNIVTNSFDAEQGMAGGAAINVTIKIGHQPVSRRRRGSITPTAISRRANYFYCLYSCAGDPNRPAKNILNQFGGMFGGPIKKNKLFLFADWERTHAPPDRVGLRTIPTARSARRLHGTGAYIYDPQTGNRRRHRPHAVSRHEIPANRIDPAVGHHGRICCPRRTRPCSRTITWRRHLSSSIATTPISR